MAYAALGVAFIGLVMMFAGVIYESNWREMDCDDDDPCTGDVCDPLTGDCINTPIACDDGNECTDDFCNPVTTTCVFIPSQQAGQGDRAQPAGGARQEPPTVQQLQCLGRKDGHVVDHGVWIQSRKTNSLEFIRTRETCASPCSTASRVSS